MRPVRSYLRGSAGPLTDLYDVALLDLDGVVYLGPEPVAGAPDALARVRQAGMRLAFVTNNAARPPEVVADHLTRLGVQATAAEVVTSAQAAARYLADRLHDGARVLVVGTVGLDEALRERGLVPVADARGEVDAVVQGYSPDMTWRLLAEGAIAINRGVPWVATNLDPTVPSPRGRLPGNGSLVAALRHATGKTPVATGKPDPAMHRESVLRAKAERPIVVGDRLDTDIEGASAVGCPSLLVLTGVTSAVELVAAPPKLRPTYVATDVGGLLMPHPDVVVSGERVASCGAWRATRAEGSDATLRLEHRSEADAGAGAAAGEAADPVGSDAAEVASQVDAGDGLDALRALCAAAWAVDAGYAGPIAGADEAAADALARLGLA
jgi:HAD superfamily hydrolase (TIGR01450 family)